VHHLRLTYAGAGAAPSAWRVPARRPASRRERGEEKNPAVSLESLVAGPIDWPLVERANKILGPINQQSGPTRQDALFLYENFEPLVRSVTSLLAANEAYRDLIETDCPGRFAADALRSNIDLVSCWAVKANEMTRFLVERLKK
jgi:hypothetical protein